jgi:hypothetical protein
VLYVTYRSNRRSDMGQNDFRRAIRSGELRYYIVGGELRIGEVGGEARRVLRFDDRDYPLRVSPVRPQSDGDKLLSLYDEDDAQKQDQRRRLVFQIEGPEDFTFRGAFIEDERRWR